MKSRLCLAFLCCLLPLSGLAAWDWPLSGLSVVLDFAGDFQDSFLTGVMIRSDDDRVRAVQAGELVLRSDGQRPSRGLFPMSFGKTVILQHDRGLRSVYTGLGRIDLPESGMVGAGDSIAGLASQADGSPAPLFFRMLDSAWQGAINPQVVLPRVNDERSPVITAAQAEPLEGGARITLSDRMEMTASSFRLFVQLHDSVGTRPTAAARGWSSVSGLPQDIRVIWNGVLVYSSSKLAIRPAAAGANRTRLVGNRLGDHALVYQPDGFTAMGELTLADGVNRLEIRAADLDGNRTSTSYRILHPAKPAAP